MHTLRTRYTHNDSDTLSETHTERKRITHLETYILRAPQHTPFFFPHSLSLKVISKSYFVFLENNLKIKSCFPQSSPLSRLSSPHFNYEDLIFYHPLFLFQSSTFLIYFLFNLPQLLVLLYYYCVD